MEVDSNMLIEELRGLAQGKLRLRGRLLSARGTPLDGSMTINQVGLQNGDVVTLATGSVAIAAAISSFAAILPDGAVASWGDKRCGSGNSSSVQDRLKNVQEVQASQHAFAALLSDGSVVSWGLTAFGGSSKPVDKLLKDVRQVQATRYAFAALLANGSVVTWGNEEYGGDSSHVEHRLKDVLQIQANHFAFAAILADGSVVTWGERNNGGDSRAVKARLTKVSCLQASQSAFTAILADGTAVFWGDRPSFGDFDESPVREQLQNVRQVHAGQNAFAALLEDGSVVTWGNATYGGDSSRVQSQLRNVRQIQAARLAFAALLEDGSVVTWGSAGHGGDSSSVQDCLKNVHQVQAGHNAFAAILHDGSVVTWGHPESGGDSSSVQDRLKGVQQIQGAQHAFAAILADGGVVTWGHPDYGGDSSAVQEQLRDVRQVQASDFAFAAARADGSADSLYRTCVRVGLCPAWEIRKNCMSVVGLDQELAGLALRIFLEKWRARTLKTRRITHDFVLVTTPQADVGEAWVPSDSEEKQMQDHLKSILTKEYGLTPARNLCGFVVPKLLLARYAGIGGEVKKAKLTRAEKVPDANCPVEILHQGPEGPEADPDFASSRSCFVFVDLYDFEAYKTTTEMVCADDEEDFVCGYPLYVDSKTREPFVLELYRAKGAAAKDLVSNRLRHDALTILRGLTRERAKPNMMHYPLPLQAMAPLALPPVPRLPLGRWARRVRPDAEATLIAWPSDTLKGDLLVKSHIACTLSCPMPACWWRACPVVAVCEGIHLLNWALLASERSFWVVRRAACGDISLPLRRELAVQLEERYGWHPQVQRGRADMEVHVLLAHDGQVGIEVPLLVQRRGLAGGLPQPGMKQVEAWAIGQTLNLRPGDVVLDPMCGKGTLLLEAAIWWPEARYVGCDADAAQLEACRENADYLGVQVATHVADVSHFHGLPLANRSVDKAMTAPPWDRQYEASGGLRSFYAAFLRELFRVLREDSSAVLLLNVEAAKIMRELLAQEDAWRVVAERRFDITHHTLGVLMLLEAKEPRSPTEFALLPWEQEGSTRNPRGTRSSWNRLRARSFPPLQPFAFARQREDKSPADGRRQVIGELLTSVDAALAKREEEKKKKAAEEKKQAEEVRKKALRKCFFERSGGAEGLGLTAGLLVPSAAT
ncbi:THUMPD2 [Symbiodinium natans]|uniref:THUMPD2 protein n=1 Tax=Symbiodinium natans TaxID=878477 RepID=A0A812QK91_9DINO|nr:THUMPD2 [Symbiodinium natans]